MYCRLLSSLFVATAMSYPYFNTSESLVPRAAKCSTPGAFVCHGSKMQGMCNLDGTADFMPVAAGTICTCSGGQCQIIASNDSAGIRPSQSLAPSIPSAPGSANPLATGTGVTGHRSPSSTGSPSASGTGHARAKHSGHKSHSGNATAPAQPSGSSHSTHAPKPSASSPSSPGSGGIAYKMYTGDGSTADGWPAMSDWLSFDAIWTGYEPLLGKNCETAFQVPNNTPEETAEIKKALLSTSQQAGVPSNFALAIMMQESLGCAHVPTTNGGVVNPGLFQDHDGAGTCAGAVACPAKEIDQMVQDGLKGTSAGPGLEQLIKQAGSSGAETYYRAARLYNSGSIAPGGDLGQGVATHCYCSDIANRLTGWFTGDSTCSLD